MVSLQRIQGIPNKSNHRPAGREAVAHGGVRQVNVEAIPGVTTDIINELDKTLNLSESQFLHL